MFNLLLPLMLEFVVITFVASILTGILKAIFFLKYKDVYRKILLSAIKYQVLGVVIQVVILLSRKSKVLSIDEPEGEFIIVIPFYFMLLGLVIEIIKLLFKRRMFLKEKVAKLYT